MMQRQFQLYPKANQLKIAMHRLRYCLIENQPHWHHQLTITHSQAQMLDLRTPNHQDCPRIHLPPLQ